MPKKATSLSGDMLGAIAEKRYAAFRKISKLSADDALPILRKGLKHWDRKLRNMCSREIIRKQGGKAAQTVLPLYIKKLLFRSSTYEQLLLIEDDALIQYLTRRSKRSDALGRICKQLYAQTKHCKKAQEKQDRIEQKKLADTKYTEVQSRSCGNPWDSLQEQIPMLKEIKKGAAQFLLIHWYRYNEFDDLYDVFEIPKRSGGKRQIEAPKTMLKFAQKVILRKLSAEVRLHEACHGFRKAHSIATNASPHVGKAIVVNLDLKNFFPTINASRVFGIYRSFGYGDVEASFLTALSLYNDHLPQGAPTSPMLANITCIRLDYRLAGLAKKIGADYTRYADDLTISGSESIINYIHIIRKIVEEEGFSVALPKLRIHRRGSRQEVTGLTVNDKVSVPRAIRRRIRAALHHVSNGEEVTWKGEPLTLESLKGHINFITSIHPELGQTPLYQSLPE